jgi:hypothetical protein
VSNIQKWNDRSHIKLTEISGYLWFAIASLEQYKSELPTNCNEHHQITCAIRHAKKALVVYSLTRHSQEKDKVRLLDESEL